MANDLNFSGEELKARFAQLVRAELPFNPVDVIDITGANVDRLQKGMKSFGWHDPRFVTEAQAMANGWSLNPQAESVEVVLRNDQTGLTENVALFNAGVVLGMPSLGAILAMSDVEIATMRGLGPVQPEVEDELSIGLARSVVREVGETEREVLDGRWERDERLSNEPNYRAIEDNSHGMMAVPTNELDAVVAQEIVAEDVAALRRITNKDLRYFATALMGANAEDQESYRVELVRQAPEIAVEAFAARLENVRNSMAGQEPAPGPDLLGDTGAGMPIKLQPGYKKLVGHGFAPYLNDAKNKTSYFAALEDEQGGIETVWGVDLDRSLSDAGVQIGDAVSLTQNGHRIVEIDEKQADGSVVKKSAKRINWDTAMQPIAVEQPLEPRAQGSQRNVGADASSAAIEGTVGVDRFAAMAPYWLDGLHNAEGVALAKEINKAIQAGKLAGDKQAIARLLAIRPKARQLGVEIVLEDLYLNDPHLKANRGEPNSLLDGALIRDKEGAYRPAAGGLAVLLDKGGSVVLKSKGAEAYRGAMELAKAKGWKAIELKGPKAMLADAWLEAKLMKPPLDVVNYAPNEKDLAKYEARVIEESKRKGVEQARPLEQAAERVEVRPFIDARGQEKLATMTYTVSYKGGVDVNFGNAKDAAWAFSGLSPADSPVVVRSVIRADGVVTEGVVAGVAQGVGKGGLAQVSEKILDHEFDDAMAEIVAKESAQASLEPGRVEAVASGIHVGPIVAIDGDRIVQKIGREAVVWHDVAKLKGVVPKLGEMAEIGYAKGMGIVKKKVLEAELDGGGRGLER